MFYTINMGTLVDVFLLFFWFSVYNLVDIKICQSSYITFPLRPGLFLWITAVTDFVNFVVFVNIIIILL